MITTTTHGVPLLARPVPPQHVHPLPAPSHAPPVSSTELANLAKKRKRGATRLSCAECRRLKLRCDRAIPCGSCVKRGCSAICPDGSLTTGKGNRFVLASTQELHEKIAQLSARVRELEDALRTSHANQASETHPLLADELLMIKAPIQRHLANGQVINGQNGTTTPEEQGAEILDSFGSLQISETGRTNYFGQATSSWYFLQNETTPSAPDTRLSAVRNLLPPEILALSGVFPIAPPLPRTSLSIPLSSSPTTVSPTALTHSSSTTSAAYNENSPNSAFPTAPTVFPGSPSAGFAFGEQDEAERAEAARLEADRAERLRVLSFYLPPVDEAAELRDIYFQHAAWMYNPISRTHFDTHAFNIFYPPLSPSPTTPETDASALRAHQLALLFMVLAVGALMDVTRPPYNTDAEKFHHLSRAALFSAQVFEEPTVVAVQALYLMAFYLFLSERHGTGVGSRWAFMGLAVKLAVSMGLHRDAGRWKAVEPVEIQRRREAFWEVYSYDLLQSYTLGRPPSFSLAHIDCKKPHTEDPQNEESFHWWKHKFTSECMNTVYDQAFGAKMPSYSTVLQLDRRLRAFPVPPLLQIAGFGSSESKLGTYYESVPLILQRHVVLAVRESNLLYMHRGFFARAISEHPRDPLGSPYGSSFIAAYRSAGSLVALVRNIHSQLKELTERMWFLWTHLFSCSIILGSIVTRCPSMSLAPSALVQLDSACELFSKTARCFHAEKVLAIMLRLRERAHQALSAHRSSRPARGVSAAPSNGSGVKSEPTSPDDEDELSTLGGRTRLVASKEKSLSPQLPDRSPTSLNPVVPLPLRGAEADQNMHPYVLQYLQTFVPTPGPHQQQQQIQVQEQLEQQQQYQQQYQQQQLQQQQIQQQLQQQQHLQQLQQQQQQQQELQQRQYQQMQQQQQQQQFHDPQASASPTFEHAPYGGDAPNLGEFSQTYASGGGNTDQFGVQVPQMDGMVFPQYFPVFDYGQHVGAVPDPFAAGPLPMEQDMSGRSYSPESATMQTAWNEFVEQIGF
ncbi:hypothetical protein OBBRIDRAFT_792742 [Obba rivulosa]|uniref:Zn(2)-C6 fungal-type domain-containing protein n=1 Tax=Obba rivulosa TaxID=1052685 RepID=A0A8E2DNR4_9APHY|nr:hypothetical protein OBBRIDRAFT_792742 [Obba rivulosa]